MLIRIAANLSELKKNLAEGKNQIEATTAGMQKLATSFQGDKLVQHAHNVAAAVNQIGGASKLTEAEQARVNRTVEAALAKYAALGKEAPQALVELAQQTRRVADEGTSWSGKLNTVVGGAVAGITAAVTNLGIQLAQTAIRGFGDFIERGGRITALRSSFEALSGGVKQADERIRAMQVATKGLVSEAAIMEATNKATLLGLGLNAQQMGELARMATILGRAMGQDATKSLDDLIVALGRTSPMILDNLGLSVKVSEANEAYARALGKTADQLTEAEKKQAFMNAALEAGRAKTEQIGGITITAADRLSQMKTSVFNLADALATWIVNLGAVNFALEKIQTSLGTWEALLRGGPRAALEYYRQATTEATKQVNEMGKEVEKASPPTVQFAVSHNAVAKAAEETVPKLRQVAEVTRTVATRYREAIPAKEQFTGLVSRSIGETAKLSNELERWAFQNGAVYASVQQVNAALQEQEPLVSTSRVAWEQFKPAVTSSLAAGDTATKGFWDTVKGAFTGKDGAVNGLTLLQGAASRMSGGWGAALQAGSAAARAFAGDWSGVVQLAGQYMDKLVGWVAEGVKKIAGWFRSVFGGPSAEELAGRELVAAFERNLDSMLNDAQRIEAGNEGWKRTVIAIRDAYIAAGLTEQQALADAERLWASSKQGAEASRRVIAEIEANMRGAGNAAVTAIDGIHRAINSLPDRVSIPIEIESSGPGLEGYANGSGGIRDFGKGTLAVLHGRERVQTESQMLAEQRGQAGGGGGVDLAAMIDRLESVLPMALRDAVLMAGAR